jgi:hypothetical protein
MKTYHCSKCKRGVCPVRKSNKRTGDILEMAETITHEDGTKERRVWGRVNERTNEILEVRFL